MLNSAHCNKHVHKLINIFSLKAFTKIKSKYSDLSIAAVVEKAEACLEKSQNKYNVYRLSSLSLSNV